MSYGDINTLYSQNTDNRWEVDLVEKSTKWGGGSWKYCFNQSTGDKKLRKETQSGGGERDWKKYGAKSKPGKGLKMAAQQGGCPWGLGWGKGKSIPD